jgi:hypothetical protein
LATYDLGRKIQPEHVGRFVEVSYPYSTRCARSARF